MFDEYQIDVPQAWKQLKLDNLHGTLLVIGGTDTGKSTFARYLYQKICTQDHIVAFLDGDPGQSTLGPPTTMTLAFSLDVGEAFVGGDNRNRRYFVGSTSPQGHMLPTVVGGARLVQAAQNNGAQAVVYDTSGLIDPRQGGLALKGAKIDMLRPTMLFAIQQEQELEPLLLPLRRSRRTQVVGLRPSPGITRRNPGVRREHRSRQFSRYFTDGRLLMVDWTMLAVFPFPRFTLNRLVALEDIEGFTCGLGIVRGIDRAARQVTLLTPLRSLDEVNALRLGDICLNPSTFEDEKIW